MTGSGTSRVEVWPEWERPEAAVAIITAAGLAGVTAQGLAERNLSAGQLFVSGVLSYSP